MKALRPNNPSAELLDRMRQEVLTYLDWVSYEVASTNDPEKIRQEITRAAARLIEISPSRLSVVLRKRGVWLTAPAAHAALRQAQSP
jgi:hypothetical protein